MGPLHTFKTRDNETILSRRISACPKIKAADDNTKKQLLANIKSKLDRICSVCSGWTHKTSDCKYSQIKCLKCGDNHFNEVCDLRKFVSCATIGSSLSKLCVQDIPASVASEPDRKVRVLFDLGSQTTLVSFKCMQGTFTHRTNFL